MSGCNSSIPDWRKMETLASAQSERASAETNELQRSIDGISQKVLTESLRQMIDDGLAYRRDYHENPPKVEYGLTDLGTEMLPIVNALADFGNYYKSVVDRS